MAHGKVIAGEFQKNGWVHLGNWLNITKTFGVAMIEPNDILSYQIDNKRSDEKRVFVAVMYNFKRKPRLSYILIDRTFYHLFQQLIQQSRTAVEANDLIEILIPDDWQL